MTHISSHPALDSTATLPRVLVVDDDHDAADILSQLLCLNGIDARPAFGGRQALELAADFDPDVVFLDLGMPVMDGFDVIRMLRGKLQSPAYIVALTAWDDPQTRARVASAGFDRHMAKPSSLASMLAVVAANVRHGEWRDDAPACLPPPAEGSRQHDSAGPASLGACKRA